ncbi:MAG: spore coat associated protein CotJA [Pelotomaculum sp.]|uniref:Spore coat associated protein JA n=1 Tax=Pelotomaculum thermopropionicum (strain DSM 13744 / JCM 10971 / SI) TaxID=370438 RepID=A5D5W5_PELTS|nr:spore coat associated protein CotJA [Pelotomaculum sp.]BAF58365.1 hypothetical protein PTH_0184 [Pelotomaculum thermopropionicum SI]
MFRKSQHPFFARPAAAVRENDKKEQSTAEEIKTEAIAPGVHAEGFYPPARLARAYVIWQKYGPTFSPAEALEKGTLFPDLYSPYPF